MESKFVKPESPFFLLTEDSDGNVSYCWWDNEEGLQEDAAERRDRENGLFVQLRFLHVEMWKFLLSILWMIL